MKKLIYIAAFTLFVLSFNAFGQSATANVSAAKTLTTAELKEDFDVLKKTLPAIHPGIYRYQTHKSLEKLFVSLEAKLEKPLPEGEFFKLVAQFANQLYCGHTYLNYLNQSSLLRQRISGGRTYLPFYFQIVGGKFIVTENASGNNLAKGSEITKINDFTTKEIVEKLLTVTHGDGRKTLGHRIKSIELQRIEAERNALFDWYFPLFFPFKGEVFSIEAVDSATKKKLSFSIPALTKEERSAEMAKRYGKSPTYDDGWKFEILSDATAYLKIENSLTWRLKTVKFKEFLANGFAKIRAKNVRNLIVDLRGNDGGDTDVGFELARHLAKTDLPPYITSRRLVRTVGARPDLLKYLDTYSDELKSNLKNGLPENYFKKAENDFFEILPNEKLENYPAVVPAENNFGGKIFIISDASNASASFQFLNYAQENRLGKIIGQATGGNKQGINGGNYFFLRLPNSRIEVDVPVYYFAPFEKQKDESVIPDIEIKPKARDIQRGIDREMLTILELIKKMPIDSLNLP